MREFWRGNGRFADLATRLAGSSDIFAAKRPSRSVNFITAHDGFTLADLVAYEHKHNEANGESNRDGTSENCSWNHGVEGKTDNPDILAARKQDQRNLIATLMFSRGTPMLSMGAEFGQSQGGNNNAYAQDNAISWADWAQADQDLTAFCAHAIALRRELSLFFADHFLTGTEQGGKADVRWRDEAGEPFLHLDWQDRGRQTMMVLLQADPGSVALVIHRGVLPVKLHLPELGGRWRVRLSTAEAQGRTENPSLLRQIPPRSVNLYQNF